MSAAVKIDINKINGECYEKNVAKLNAIGLPELTSKINPANPWNTHFNHIVLGLDNKALLCRNQWAHHIAETISELLGGKMECSDFERSGRTISYFVSITGLTVPERKALEVFIRYFDSYYPGIQADSQDILFPSAMKAYAAPAAYINEIDAYEAAEVLAEITRMDTSVLEVDEGYAVIIHDEGRDITDYNFACVLGACQVLENFAVVRKNKPCLDIHDDYEGAIPWQKAVGKRYTQQSRIEAKIDRLLESEAAVTRDARGNKLDEILLRLNRMEIKQRLFAAEPAGMGNI